MSQSDNGKAYEYALARRFNMLTGVGIQQDKPSITAEQRYNGISADARQRMDDSAERVANFLLSKDATLESMESIVIQGDAAGRAGDVRDLVLRCGAGKAVGVSAKHMSEAVRHSRLSDTIDFGLDWGGRSVSDQYWRSVKPIFESMREAGKKGKLFRETPNKEQVYYLPILTAFEDELRRLCEDYSAEFIRRFFQYLIGEHDYYKAICKSDRSIVQSVNMNGTLKWGSKWKTPTRVEQIRRKRGTSSILLVTFEGGWQLSFRLHNAAGKVEPSLKFDIQFVGLPRAVARNEISHS